MSNPKPMILRSRLVNHRVTGPSTVESIKEGLKAGLKAHYKTRLHTAADTVLDVMHDTALGPDRAALFALASTLYVEGEQ